MTAQKGRIVSRDGFFQNSAYSKEEYEGLIVSADTVTGLYNIGLEINAEQILLLDQVADTKVAERVQEIMPSIQEIQTLLNNPDDDSQGDEEDTLHMSSLD